MNNNRCTALHFTKESKLPNKTIMKGGDIICETTIGFVCITQRRLQALCNIASEHFLHVASLISFYFLVLNSHIFHCILYIFYFNPLWGLVLLHYSKWLQNIALIEDTCILLCWNIHVCNSIHNIILTYRIYLLLTDLRKTLNSCWIRFQQSRDTYRSSLQKIFVRSFETNINVQHFTLTLWYL